jgi:methylase of polypeptide subunit release factors
VCEHDLVLVLDEDEAEKPKEASFVYLHYENVFELGTGTGTLASTYSVSTER